MARRLTRWLLVLAVALCSGPLLADYKDDYQDGVEAAGKGDWATVKRLMQSVLRENSKPQRNMRTYGVNRIDFVPHYYLGLAELRLNNCQGALQAFNNAASKAVVAQVRELSGQQSGFIKQCEDQLRLAQNDPPKPVVPPVDPPKPPPPVDPPKPPRPDPPKPPPPTAKLASADVQRVSNALASAQRSARNIQSSLGAAPLAGTGDARALSGDLDASKRQLSSAETQLANARRQDSPNLLAQAEDGIKQAAGALRVLGDRVESAKRGLAAAAEAEALRLTKRRAQKDISDLQPVLAEAEAAGASTAAARTALAQQSSALQSALKGDDGKAIDRAVAALATARRDLEQAIAGAPQPAPEELRRYVGLYLAGDYAAVASWAAPEQLPRAKDQAQGLLLRAAARLHQYVRSGEMDNALSAAIGTDLRKAKSLDRQLKPNTRAFSPRFIELFNDA
ncbi:MAG: hypothetical protein KDI71_15125 [Xanthomonadales bacterium]|nr:hypothetical protein [Xanthomonadales bacterium]